jgi:hypothetical protein
VGAELEAKLAGIRVFIDRHNMWIDSAVHNSGGGLAVCFRLFLWLDVLVFELKVIPSYRCLPAY